MRKIDGKKMVRIAVSILVALGIWIYVGIVDPVDMQIKAKNVPIVFVGEDTVLADKGLMVVTSSTDKVDLTLKAQRRVFWDLDSDDLRLLVDLREIEDVGSYTLSYSVDYPDNVQKNKISIDHASAYSITVEIGELFKKTVDVQYEITGAVPDGYVMREAETGVSALSIHGQQEDVMRVSYAKISFDVTGHTSSVNEMIAPQYYDSGNKLLENVTIYANKKTLPVTIPIYMVKDVKLTVELLDGPGVRAEDVSVTVQPDTLRLAGEYYLMESMEEYSVGSIDLSGITSGESKSVNLTLPAGVIAMDGTKDVLVSIALKNVATREFTVNRFAAANVPEGLAAEIATASLNVTLRGRNEVLDELSVEDIQVSADLSHIETAGSHTVPAIVRYTGDADIGVIGSYELTVTVK